MIKIEIKKNHNNIKIVPFNNKTFTYKFLQESVRVRTELVQEKKHTDERILIMLEQSKDGIKKKLFTLLQNLFKDL